MSEKGEVFEIIKSVITSQKGGVLLKDINRDYRNLAGDHIPFKTLGYNSIEQVLEDIPEVQSYVNDDGQLVFINKGKNCEHLVKLISKQKGSSTKKLKPSNLGFHQELKKPRNSDIGVLRTQRGKEKENNAKCMGRQSVGSWNEVGKMCANNYTRKQKNGAYPRKSAADCYPNSSRRGRGWTPLGYFDESLQLEHGEEDTYDLVIDDRMYAYKSSKSLGRRESFHGAHKHDHRDVDRFHKRDDGPHFSENCDMKNWHSASYSSNNVEKFTGSRPNSFRVGRYSHSGDFPSTSCYDIGSNCPTTRNYYNYPKHHMYRNRGDTRYVPEDNDWDASTYYDHRCGGRLEMDRSSRLDESIACGHSGRKIDVISGSLRVTIKNY